MSPSPHHMRRFWIALGAQLCIILILTYYWSSISKAQSESVHSTTSQTQTRPIFTSQTTSISSSDVHTNTAVVSQLVETPIETTKRWPFEIEREFVLTEFSPLRLTECNKHTPAFYAPCLRKKIQHAVSGEELIYPAFVTSPPIFAPSRPQDEESWSKVASSVPGRGIYQGNGGLVYMEQHGQTYVRRSSLPSQTAQLFFIDFRFWRM